MLPLPAQSARLIRLANLLLTLSLRFTLDHYPIPATHTSSYPPGKVKFLNICIFLSSIPVTIEK
jgi:hypothetical protein